MTSAWARTEKARVRDDADSIEIARVRLRAPNCVVLARLRVRGARRPGRERSGAALRRRRQRREFRRHRAQVATSDASAGRVCLNHNPRSDSRVPRVRNKLISRAVDVNCASRTDAASARREHAAPRHPRACAAAARWRRPRGPRAGRVARAARSGACWCRRCSLSRGSRGGARARRTAASTWPCPVACTRRCVRTSRGRTSPGSSPRTRGTIRSGRWSAERTSERGGTRRPRRRVRLRGGDDARLGAFPSVGRGRRRRRRETTTLSRRRCWRPRTRNRRRRRPGRRARTGTQRRARISGARPFRRATTDAARILRVSPDDSAREPPLSSRGVRERLGIWRIHGSIGACMRRKPASSACMY